MLPATAQSIRRLYASEPPLGSTFVRIVNPTSHPVSVSLGAQAAISISAGGEIVTPYAVVPGGAPLGIRVDGASLHVPDNPAPETFVTVVLNKTTSGYTLNSIVDVADKAVGLNAELIFYNLIQGCAGTLGVTDGPVVFNAVPAESSQQRAVNPVAASLTGTCGTAHTPALALPPLKAGDYYSIFLVGDPGSPLLVGALDQTALLPEAGH